MADAPDDVPVDQISEQELLKGIFKIFQNNPLDKRAALTKQEKIVIFSCLIDSFIESIDPGESDHLFYSPRPEVIFFRTANSHVDDLDDKKPLFMNLTPKANLFVDVSVDSVKTFKPKKEIRFLNLTLLSLLIGFSIKSGRKEYGEEDPRGIFDIFSYDIYPDIARIYGVDGFILFDSIDAYQFRVEDPKKIVRDENRATNDASVVRDLVQNIAIPLIPIASKLEYGGALYPEFILAAPNKKECLEQTSITGLADFYNNPDNTAYNGDPAFNFQNTMGRQHFIDPDTKDPNPYIVARQKLINELFPDFNYPYAFPYLYPDPVSNKRIFYKFFDLLVGCVHEKAPSFKMAWMGKHGGNIKTRRKKIKNTVRNKYNKYAKKLKTKKKLFKKKVSKLMKIK